MCVYNVYVCRITSREGSNEMDLSTVRPITVACDRIAFPCLQAYVHTDGTFWWVLDYLHQALEVKLRKFLWLRWVSKLLSGVQLLADSPFMFLSGSVHEPGMLKANICTTVAIVALFWQYIGRCRNDRVSKACQQYLARQALRACEVIEHCDIIVLAGKPALRVTRGGLVQGLGAVFAFLHSQVVDAYRSVWTDLHSDHSLSSAFVSDTHTHTLSDIVVFTALYAPHQRNKKRVVSERALSFLKVLHDVLVPWIAGGFEKYVRNVYCHTYDTSRPPPALSTAADGKRHYVKVEPRFVWNLMERARAASVSLRQAIALRRLDEDAGCSVAQADLWTGRYHDIYWKRQSTCIGDTVHHVNIVCDPSTKIFLCLSFGVGRFALRHFLQCSTSCLAIDLLWQSRTWKLKSKRWLRQESWIGSQHFDNCKLSRTACTKVLRVG